ncbi:hypothetical protein DAI22_05g116800 [Oryza sativa Japonica Group]|nr:hypothetical protein DAI22_05g116800 [Oryza sativa Japonica Group]
MDQVDSILITPCPLRIEAHARESYDIDTVSKATRQSCQVYFDSAEQSSQCVQEMRLDEATNSNMLTAQQQPQRQLYRHLERHHKKIVASEAQALHGNVETPIRMNKAKEFPKIVRDHEACLLSFYHPAPIPSHVMNMLHWCFGIDMERKMPLPKRYPTQCYGTPRIVHQNGTLGFRRSYVDFPHRDDLKSLDNKELNVLLFQRKFSGLSKGNYLLFSHTTPCVSMQH